VTEQPSDTKLEACEMCEREVEKLYRYLAYLNEAVYICKDCLEDIRSTLPPKQEP
jgi:hypothetical protein